MKKRRAVFLDRDGTLIEHVHYLADPTLVRVLPGVANALNRWEKAGYLRIVVTNQAAIDKGLLTVEGLVQIHLEMKRQLIAEGAHVDAIYFAPIRSVGSDPTVVEHPYRKPGPGMLQRATREHHLDIHSSWCVGDAISDVLAGINAGCRGSILIGREMMPEGIAGVVVGDITAAADYILANHP